MGLLASIRTPPLVAISTRRAVSLLSQSSYGMPVELFKLSLAALRPRCDR